MSGEDFFGQKAIAAGLAFGFLMGIFKLVEWLSKAEPRRSGRGKKVLKIALVAGLMLAAAWSLWYGWTTLR